MLQRPGDGPVLQGGCGGRGPGAAEVVGEDGGQEGGRAGGSGKLPGEAGRWSRTEGRAWTASRHDVLTTRHFREYGH